MLSTWRKAIWQCGKCLPAYIYLSTFSRNLGVAVQSNMYYRCPVTLEEVSRSLLQLLV